MTTPVAIGAVVAALAETHHASPDVVRARPATRPPNAGPRRGARTRLMSSFDPFATIARIAALEVVPPSAPIDLSRLPDQEWQQLLAAVRAERIEPQLARAVIDEANAATPAQIEAGEVAPRAGHGHDVAPRPASCSRWPRSSSGAGVDFVVLKGSAAAHLDRSDPSCPRLRRRGPARAGSAHRHGRALVGRRGWSARVSLAAAGLRSAVRQGLVVPDGGRARHRPSSHARSGPVRTGHRTTRAVRRAGDVRARWTRVARARSSSSVPACVLPRRAGPVPSPTRTAPRRRAHRAAGSRRARGRGGVGATVALGGGRARGAGCGRRHDSVGAFRWSSLGRVPNSPRRHNSVVGCRPTSVLGVPRRVSP